MDMKFKDGARRRRVVLIVGVLLAVVAGGTAFSMSSASTEARVAEIPTRTVIVAARDIAARTLIEAADLTTRALPEDPSLGQAATDPTQLIGRLTGVPVLADQPLTLNLIATTVAGAQFSVIGPTESITPDSPQWRAVSVKVPKDRAVGGAIEPGQHVDLLVTLQVPVDPDASPDPLNKRPFYSATSTKIALEDVPVLAKMAEEDMYILKVDLHQAEEISHVASSDGGTGFSLVLRADGDDRSVDRGGYGETTTRILERYAYPVPQMIDLGAYREPVALPSPPSPSAQPQP